MCLVRLFLKNTGTRKSTQTFSGQSFSRTLRVMDLRTKNRGHPHRKVCFPAALVVGRNFLTPGHPGVVRNVCRKFGPKSGCLFGDFFSGCIVRARKRHIIFFHINFLRRPSSPALSQGQTEFVPGTNPVKSGFHCVK